MKCNFDSLNCLRICSDIPHKEKFVFIGAELTLIALSILTGAALWGINAQQGGSLLLTGRILCGAGIGLLAANLLTFTSYLFFQIRSAFGYDPSPWLSKD